MSHGYWDRIVRVNLTTNQVETESPGAAFYRTYFGGKGLAAHYLLKEVPAGCDPLGPDNLLVFAVSPLTGAPAPALSRFTVAALSPLTGRYGEGEAGGFWGAWLKFAGADAILVCGRASVPVYLHVHDGTVDVRDASAVWGRTTGATVDALKNEVGDPQARVVSIGPGGERMVRYACVIEGTSHAAGRTGMGAVMGSKLLKAVVVSGGAKVPLADRDRVLSIARWFAAHCSDNPLTGALQRRGTIGVLPGLNAGGMLPTRNFRDGSFDKWEAIGPELYHDRFFTGGSGCYACPVRCKRDVKDGAAGRKVESRYGGPEYETVASFGSNLGISDAAAICELHQICNENSVDTISAGVAIAFAMECYENGLLSASDCDGVEARFGSVDAAFALLDQIVNRTGIGRLLGEGVARAAAEIGGDAARYAMQAGGQEIPMHEPRGKVGVGLGYAVAETGADHMVAAHDTMFLKPAMPAMAGIAPLGLLDTVDPLDLGPAKVRHYLYLEQLWSALKSLSVCFFGVAPRGLMPLPVFVDLVSAITGWDTSLWEIMKGGERALNLCRVFNLWHRGHQPEELPARFAKAFPSGPLAGVRISPEDMQKAVELHHLMAGWSRAGRPGLAKLHELGIGWAGDYLPELAGQVGKGR